MHIKLWPDVREYLERTPVIGTTATTQIKGQWNGVSEIYTKIFSTGDAIWSKFSYVDMAFPERSEEFEAVWNGITTEPYQERILTSYLSNEGDTSIAYILHRLDPIQLFCESVLEQVGLSEFWTVVISTVSLGDQRSFDDGHSFIAYVIELAPKDTDMVIDETVDRSFGDRSNWPKNPSRPPVPLNGIRVPLMGCVVSQEGSCPPKLMRAAHLESVKQTAYFHDDPKNNGLCAVQQTVTCSRQCFIPQVWYGDSSNLYLFDYSVCNMDSTAQGFRGVATIYHIEDGRSPLMLMAQECLENILRMLPQWRIPMVLWETNQYAPYPHHAYLPPFDVTPCRECPQPFATSIKAWSRNSCRECGGWGYLWYNEEEEQHELYWKPPVADEWALSWTSTGNTIECKSPILVGQTTNGKNALLLKDSDSE